MDPSNGRTDGQPGWGSENRTDECLHLLADGRRREVLRCVEENGAVPIDDLVRRLEADDRSDETRVSTSLYHVHLPKLSSGDLVEFDPGRGRVEKAEWPALVDDLVHWLD